MTEHDLLLTIARDVGEIKAGFEALGERVQRSEEEIFGCDESPGLRTRVHVLEKSDKRREIAEAALAAEASAMKSKKHQKASLASSIGAVAAAIVSAIMGAISVFGSGKH